MIIGNIVLILSVIFKTTNRSGGTKWVFLKKKYCDICGDKIGLLGNRKIADGNICNNCSNKLSPHFKGLKNSTLQAIQNQLAYRQQNMQNLNYFNPTKVLGTTTKVYIDENQRKLVVSRKSDYKSENADIIDLSQVSSVRSDVKEHRSEIYTKDANGNRTSYNPPRYEYTYEINIIMNVNSPYFNEIKFEVTDRRPKDKMSDDFRRYEHAANEIIAALGGTPVYSNNVGFNNAYGNNPMGNNMGANGLGNNGFNNAYGNNPMGNNMGANGLGNNGFNNAYGNNPMGNNMGGNGLGNNGFNNAYGNNPMGNNMGMNGFGQPQGIQWICPMCGTQNTSDFCRSCGSRRQ